MRYNPKSDSVTYSAREIERIAADNPGDIVLGRALNVEMYEGGSTGIHVHAGEYIARDLFIRLSEDARAYAEAHRS